MIQVKNRQHFMTSSALVIHIHCVFHERHRHVKRSRKQNLISEELKEPAVLSLDGVVYMCVSVFVCVCVVVVVVLARTAMAIIGES